MTDWIKDVYSSNVATVGYDSEKKELYVTFSRTGQQYTYSGVPEQLAIDLSNAPSVTGMLNTEIKPYYGFRKG